MKKATFIIIGLIICSISYCQPKNDTTYKPSSLFIQGPVYKLIDTLSKILDYKVIYDGGKPTYFRGLSISLEINYSMPQILALLQNKPGFFYKIVGRSLTIFNPYSYEVDIPGKDSTISIKNYFDTIRNCEILKFQSVQPSRILDFIEKHFNIHLNNNTQIPSILTVSGLLPLNYEVTKLFQIICPTHNWLFLSERKNYYSIEDMHQISYQELRRYYPYTIDLHETNEPAYLKVYYDSLQKYCVADFRHVSPYAILDTLMNQVDCKVRFTEGKKALKPVSGTLPLCLPGKVILELFCRTHEYCYDGDKKRGFILTTNCYCQE